MAADQRNAFSEFWDNILIKEGELNKQLSQSCDELSSVKAKLQAEKSEYIAEVFSVLEPNCTNYMSFQLEENLAFTKALNSQVESDRNKTFECFKQLEQCKVDMKKRIDHSDEFDDCTEKPYDDVKTEYNSVVEDIRILLQSLEEQKSIGIKCCEEFETSYQQLLDETAFLERFENESKCALSQLANNCT